LGGAKKSVFLKKSCSETRESTPGTLLKYHIVNPALAPISRTEPSTLMVCDVIIQLFDYLGTKDLEQQWESVFGDFVEGPKEDISAAAPTPTDNASNQQSQQQSSGFLPSQLLDMMAMENTGGA